MIKELKIRFGCYCVHKNGLDDPVSQPTPVLSFLLWLYHRIINSFFILPSSFLSSLPLSSFLPPCLASFFPLLYQH